MGVEFEPIEWAPGVEVPDEGTDSEANEHVRAPVAIGNDPETAGAINSMGAEHVECEARDCVVDEDHKVVSTPAYMLAQRISEAAEGIEKAVKNVLGLI